MSNILNYTEFKNATDINYFYVDAGVGSDFVQEVVTNIEKLHYGGELGFAYQATSEIKLSAVASYGDYSYSKNAEVSINFDTVGAEDDLINLIGTLDLGKTNIKDYKLAVGPQKAYSIGVDYRSSKYWWVGITGNYLADNYIEADPLVTPAHIVPEWYLLPFYAILRAVPSKLGGVIVMFSSIFVLVLLPWLDSSKVRSATFRPLYKKFFWVLVVAVILLGYLGAKPPEGIYLILARFATTYYFVHFLLILPLLSRYEKTDPLPLSISDPVLDKPGTIDKFKKLVGEYEGENVSSFK